MRSIRLALLDAVVFAAAFLIACSTDDSTPSPASNTTAAVGGSSGLLAGAVASASRPTTGAAGRGGAAVQSNAGSPVLPPPTSTAPVIPPPMAATTPPPPMAAAPMAAAPMPAAPAAPATPPGTWPAAEPGARGPFPTTTEENVGPGLGYLLIRPTMLTQRHPVITWGNGTGGMPQSYGQLLGLFASHGFIVVASNSGQVAQDQPPPMLEGVKWVLEQDKEAGSPLFGKVDRERIGATGHSQGAFATTAAGTDPLIKTIAAIEALAGSRGFHGPVLGICGAMDMAVPCSGNQRSFMGITDQPAMHAEALTVDHSNWIFSPQGLANPIYVITTAWFRVHLMDDKALRPMFYGECTLCKDTATWSIMRARMDN